MGKDDYRAEAIAVSIFEYEEKHMKNEREEGREELARMLKSLMDAGETEALERALSDRGYRESLYHEYMHGDSDKKK